MKTVACDPHFAQLSHAEVMQHVDADVSDKGSQSDDPVMVELERLVEAYSLRFETLCKEKKGFPEEVLGYEPEIGIEKVAFEIFNEALHDAMLDLDDDE